jgi:hypothetical protein
MVSVREIEWFTYSASSHQLPPYLETNFIKWSQLCVLSLFSRRATLPFSRIRLCIYNLSFYISLVFALVIIIRDISHEEIMLYKPRKSKTVIAGMK